MKKRRGASDNNYSIIINIYVCGTLEAPRTTLRTGRVEEVGVGAPELRQLVHSWNWDEDDYILWDKDAFELQVFRLVFPGMLPLGTTLVSLESPLSTASNIKLC